MWALDDGSLAFIHIPKNAGTSITNQLNLDERTRRKDKLNWLDNHYSKHDTASNIRKMLEKIHPSPVLFAIIRNPYARAYSMWLQYVMPSKQAHEGKKSMWPEYDEYIAEYYGDSDQGFKRFLIHKPAWHWHPRLGVDKQDLRWDGWWPQFRWLSDDKENQCIVDHVFDIEKLGKLKFLLRDYGIAFSPKIKENIKTGKDYRPEYDAESIKLVRKVFAIDFDKLGLDVEFN